MHSRLLPPFLVALSLLAAACGNDTTDTGALPPDGDAPPAAGACLEGAVDCDDTPGDLGGPDLEPGDEPGPVDEPTDLPGDGVLTPEDVLGLGTSTDQIAVRGAYWQDSTGAYLCGALAESFPPQCGGGALLLEGLDLAALSTPLSQEQGITWTDTTITLSGTVDNGVFTVADVEG